MEHEHNGCIGHPVTNLLMGASTAAITETFAAAVAGPVASEEQHPGAAAHQCAPEPDELGADEFPVELLQGLDEMAEKVETAVRQVSDTDERTAHLVITCERLARGQVEILEKLDRILNHFKVA